MAAKPKTILDYTGKVNWSNDFAALYLGDMWQEDDGCWVVESLEDRIISGLDVAGEDWHGTLHILVELVEEGDDER